MIFKHGGVIEIIIHQPLQRTNHKMRDGMRSGIDLETVDRIAVAVSANVPTFFKHQDSLTML
uniref:Uncharacterized protein n=1 Tax=Candidatus Methanogaster sp. ANME-2c ERB4 TaxID=2759911 RepID=A0A7G9YNQ8_9EURY|nr:hypothetical protein CIDMNOHP_00005 [Methanosarcinales archaeon ANME-2c ERB4]